MSPQLREFIDRVIVPNLLELWLREQGEASRQRQAEGGRSPRNDLREDQPRSVKEATT